MIMPYNKYLMFTLGDPYSKEYILCTGVNSIEAFPAVDHFLKIVERSGKIKEQFELKEERKMTRVSSAWISFETQGRKLIQFFCFLGIARKQREIHVDVTATNAIENFDCVSY